MTKKHERDEFHMKALTPAGVLGIRKKGHDETITIATAPMEANPDPDIERVQATRRSNEPTVFDLRPSYATAKGPAQVATNTYRKGHERIFGKRKHSIN